MQRKTVKLNRLIATTGDALPNFIPGVTDDKSNAASVPAIHVPSGIEPSRTQKRFDPLVLVAVGVLAIIGVVAWHGLHAARAKIHSV